MTNPKTFFEGRSEPSLSHAKDKDYLGKCTETSSNLLFSDHRLLQGCLAKQVPSESGAVKWL